MSYHLSDLLGTWLNAMTDVSGQSDHMSLQDLAQCLSRIDVIWSKIVETRLFSARKDLLRLLVTLLSHQPNTIDCEGLLLALVASNHHETIRWFHESIQSIVSFDWHKSFSGLFVRSFETGAYQTTVLIESILEESGLYELGHVYMYLLYAAASLNKNMFRFLLRRDDRVLSDLQKRALYTQLMKRNMFLMQRHVALETNKEARQSILDLLEAHLVGMHPLSSNHCVRRHGLLAISK